MLRVASAKQAKLTLRPHDVKLKRRNTIMKKTYIAPAVEVVKVDAVEIIASSVPFGGAADGIYEANTYRDWNEVWKY